MAEEVSEIDDNTDELNRAESLDTLLKRQAKERQEAFERLKAEARSLGSEMQAGINETAAEAMREALETVRQRIAGGSVPVIVEFGGISPEDKIRLERARQATGDAAAVVVIIPRPDAYGLQKREAWAIVDVSDMYRG